MILGNELRTFSIEDFQEVDNAPFVSHPCQFRGRGARLSGSRGGDELIAGPGMGYQSVLSLFEGTQDGFFILRQSGAVAGLRPCHPGMDPAEVEGSPRNSRVVCFCL